MRAGLLLSLCLAACRPEQVHCRPEPDFPPDVEMGPQLAHPAPDAMTVAWRTVRPLVGAVACAGKTVADPAPTTEHVLRLEGLEPGATYTYRLLHDGEPVGEEASFATPVRPGAPFRFAVIGDSGSGCAEQFEVAARIAAEKPAFVLHTGDVAYPRATREALVLRYFVPYAPLLRTVPFYPSHGDHDTAHEKGAVLRDLLYLPGNERFYSFDWGDLHVAVLDSMLALEEGGEQFAWLDADLAAARARWTVVCVHHPPYSSGRHKSIRRVRAIVPLVDRHGVDLVLSGNDHLYERSFPMRDGRVVEARADPDYTDAKGAVYVVSGGGGQILYRRGSSYFTAVGHAAYHTTVIDVAPDRLVVRTVLDRATLAKSG